MKYSLMSTMKKVGAATAALALLISFQNCAEQKFSSSGSSVDVLNLGNSDDDATGVITQTGGPNCRDELKALTTPVKMVFVVDASGSNVSNPGSDPQKAVRAGSIQRFYNAYSAKANFAWGFTTFAGSAASTLVANGSSSAMQAAIQTFTNQNDNGNTPYAAALDEATAIISGDVGRLPNTKYIVVFLSDGLPNPSISDANLNAKVMAVKNAAGAGGQVSVNTVYYGEVNPDASGRLQMMAATGAGNFLDTNVNPTGNAFLISDLIIVPGVVCQ